jgi:hypothetical protein
MSKKDSSGCLFSPITILLMIIVTPFSIIAGLLEGTKK